MTSCTSLTSSRLPWRPVRGFRNILVHRYFAVDWRTVLDTARGDVPDVEAHVLGYLREHHPEIAERFTESDGFAAG